MEMKGYDLNGVLFICLAALALLSTAAADVETRLSLDYDLTYADDDLRPGDVGVMNVVIKNVGSQEAQNVEITIPDAGDIRVSKKQYVGTIPAGGVQVVSTSFSIAKNATLGVKTIKVNAVYDGFDAYGKPENDRRDSWELNLDVKGESIFVIEDITVDRKLKPGETVNILASVRNKGIAEAFDVQVQISLPTDLVKVMGPEKQFLGDIGGGGAAGFGFVLYLDDDLPEGAYSIPLLLSYMDHDHDSQTSVLPVGVLVEGETRMAFSIKETDPKEIHAGDEEVEINVKFDNVGTRELKNVRVSFVPRFPFENSRSYEQIEDLGIVKGSESVERTFYADVDEEAGACKGDQLFVVSYTIDGAESNSSFTIPVEVKDYPDFEVLAPKVYAAQGTESELRINVTNTGSDCDSVTVWVLKKSDMPFDFEDKSDFIGDLSKGDGSEAVIRFAVDADAKVKDYSLPLEIRCTRDDEVLVYGDKVDISVLVNGKPDTTIYLVPGILLLVCCYGVYRVSGKKKVKARNKGKE